MADYVTLQDAVDGLRADNQALTDEVLAGNTTATTAKADAEAARVAAELAETNAKQSEILSLQYKDSAEAAVPLAEQHKLDAEAQVPLAQAEKTAAEAARDSAVLTALGPDNDKLASIASVYSQPSLNLDFAKQSFWKQGKYPWNQEALDPAVDLTFTRASTATYFDAQGVLQTAAADEMRFDHDPVTGEPLGVLIEPARTNEIHTPDLTTGALARMAGWNSQVEGVPVPGLVDDSVAIATRMTVSGSSGSRTFFREHTGNKTLSVFVKTETATSIVLGLHSGTSGRVHFDLSGEGAVSYLPPNLSDATVRKINDGWYRITATMPSSYTGARDGVRFWVSGEAGQSALFLLPQLEDGLHATSPIPTNGGPVTRAGDLLTCDFGAEVDKTRGTVVYDGEIPEIRGGVNSSGTPYTLNRGKTAWSSLSVIRQDEFSRFVFYNGSTNSQQLSTLLDSTTGWSPGRTVVAQSWEFDRDKNTSRVISSIGGAISRNLRSYSQTSVDRVIRIYISPDAYYTSRVKSMRVFPRAMTEAELVELTS